MTEKTATSTDTTAYRGPIDPKHEQLVLVLDFGSQTAQLIARRVREQNVFCQLVRHDLTVERIRELKPRGLILSGGPQSVFGESPIPFNTKLLELDLPIVGLCYGHQLLAHHLGGDVRNLGRGEYGKTDPGKNAQ